MLLLHSEMTYPCSVVMPLLPATMLVQELNVGRRQRLRHHDPGVQNLAGCHAHQSCVPMLPPGWRQNLSDSRWCIWLVSTAYEQSRTPQQNVERQTGVSVLSPVNNE